MNNSTANQTDRDVVNLSKAIIQHESGGNFTVPGKSKEYGGAQWIESTWNAEANKYLGYVPKWGTAEMTPEIQKAVLYSKVLERKKAGFNPAQIAAEHNSGSPDGWENKIGVNKYGVQYNVPAYVKSVTDLYQTYKGQNAPSLQNNTLNQSSEVLPLPTAGAQPDTGLKGFATGIAQGEIKTARGLQSFGNAILSPIKSFLGLSDVKTGFDSLNTDTQKGQKVSELLEAQNASQATGQFVEQLAEFLAPSSGIVKGQKALSGLISGTGKGANLARLGVKSATESTLAAGQTALKEDGDMDKVKTAAIIASLFPVAGKALSVTTKGVGSILGKGGQKIQTSVIKPSVSDVRDGFKIENINKFGLGGSLQDTLTKTNQRLNELGQKLKLGLKDSVVPVNLNKVFDGVEQKLGGNKLANFGNNSGIARILNNLKQEITDVAGPNGLVDLVEAQLVKRGAGTKGAWVFGSADPDATAVEKVYNLFYHEIKTAIEEAAEKSGFAGVRDINREISDLIPISNAVLRRIPIDQRNNAISLTEGLMLLGSVFDPRALALIGVNKLSKSGKFGQFLVNVGAKMKSSPTSAIGERVIGK